MRRHTSTGRIGLVVMLAAVQVLAAPIAFDPFPIGAGDYTDNANIVGQGPTGSPIVGFTGNWAGGTSLAKSSSTGLDAHYVTESGGSLSFAGYNDTFTRTVSRSFTEQAAVMTNGATVYWSGIVTLNGTDSDADDYITWTDDAAASSLLVRFGIIDGRLKVQLSTTTMDLGAYTPGDAYHIVVEGTINVSGANDAAKVWIDPLLSDVVDGTNTATNRSNISFVGNTGFDMVVITSKDVSASLTARFDELVHTADIDDLNLLETLPQSIRSATFDPMPTPDDGGSYDHNITHDFDLIGITLNAGRYTGIEGPTNVVESGGHGIFYPQSGVAPGSKVAALTGLAVNGSHNLTSVDCMFATTVTNGFDGGFFLVELNGDDAITVNPLDADGNPISTWSLSLAADVWGDDLTGLGSSALRVNFDPIGVQAINGLAFTLSDFTNGVGTLTDVKGLRIGGGGSLDLVMAGVYQGPTDPLASGTAAAMTAATFNPTPTGNPITHDFDVAGISTATETHADIRGASPVNEHEGAGLVFYPSSGSAPASREAAMTGLAINGVTGSAHAEFMFSTPVRKAEDGFFIIEHSGEGESITIRPLDASRFPISTYSITVSAGDWGSSLTVDPIDWNSVADTSVHGIVCELSDFVGGTGGLPGNVYGIRIESADSSIDPVVVGAYALPPTGTLIAIQ